MSKVKNQHYVSQFYLKLFSYSRNNENYLNIYDKQNNKSFESNIKNICSEKGFYDTKGDKYQIVEKKFLSQFEGIVTSSLNRLIESPDLRFLSDQDKFNIASFIALQRFRVKEMNEIERDANKQTLEKTKKMYDKKHHKDLEDYFIKDSEEEKRSMIMIMFKSVLELSKLLYIYDWRLLLNNTGTEFITSDCPVVLYNDQPRNFYGNYGFMSYGIQFYIPISPNLCIYIIEPFYGRKLKFGGVGHKINCDLPEVIMANHLQLVQSTRFVLSQENDFGVIKEWMKNDPELGNPNRKRNIVS